MLRPNIKMFLLFLIPLLGAFPAFSSDLIFLPTWMPDATVGQTYELTLTGQGGMPSYTFSITAGSLPDGLSLDQSSGLIDGVPYASGSYSITIRITDYVGNNFSRTFTLKVSTLAITNPNILPPAIYGRYYNYQFAAFPAGSYKWAMVGSGGYPASLQGLTLNPDTGELSGTSGSPFFQSMSFGIRATSLDGQQSVTKYFTLFSPTLQQQGNPWLGNAQRDDAIIGTEYQSALTLVGGTPPFHVSLVDGSLPPGINLVPAERTAATAGFGVYSLYGISNNIGLFTFKLRCEDGSGLVSFRTTSLRVSGLTSITTSLSTAVYGLPYTFQLQGATTYSVADGSILPPGLALSPDGILSGTPRATGYNSFAINFVKDNDMRRVTLTLNVLFAPNKYPTFSYSTTPSLGAFILQGSPQKFSLTAAPNSYPPNGSKLFKWELLDGSLPPGLSLISSEGYSEQAAIIEGIPTTAGDSTFRLRVEDSNGNFIVVERTVTVTPLRSPASSSLPFTAGYSAQSLAASVGDFFSFQWICVNGVMPCSYEFVPPNSYGYPSPFLPPGLTMNADGVISGIPSESGGWGSTIRITDAAGNKFQSFFAIEVYPADMGKGIFGLVIGEPLEDATLNSPYSFSLEDLLYAGRGQRPIVWTLDSGSLPPGISIVPGIGSGSASLAGIPTVSGNYTFTLVATDANGYQHLVDRLTLKVTALNVAPAALPQAVSGVPYYQQLTATDGVAPYLFRMSSRYPLLPPGISLSITGELSGTPNVVTDYPCMLLIEAVDANGAIFFKRYRFDVTVPTWTDGVIPSTGGEVRDLLWGSKAVLSVPSGVLVPDTQVAVNVLDPSASSPPGGFSSSSSYLVEFNLTPSPSSYPLPDPGATITLPLLSTQVPGTILDLFVFDPDTGELVPALNAAGYPITGQVNADGLSATFAGVAHFSTYYAQAIEDYELSVGGPTEPFAVNTPVTFSATLNPNSLYDRAVWTWGDGLIAESSASGAELSATHSYSQAGVYTVYLDLYIGNTCIASADFRYAVIYDPLAGFVTGGGWIVSPPGAYAADPLLTGKASFGFVSKYLRGTNTPSGNTEFQFKAGNLEFKSSHYDWLVVAGSKAMFKGTGSINGADGFGFMISAIDGQIQNGDGIDRFRIKIHNPGTGGVIYDNLMNAGDNADPTTELGGGNITIHKGK
jgi:hypothetical protein